jgi:hypothetical protein
MMGGMGYPSDHYPGYSSFRIKKGDFLFPPGFILLLQSRESFSGIFGIARNEFKTHFCLRQRWGAGIDAQHSAKPFVFTETLVEHVLERVPLPFA